MSSFESYSIAFETCVITTDPARLNILDRVTEIAIRNRSLYETVERFTHVPWPLISAIHFREAGQSFKSHLHNGDPLTERTVHVPKGRPELGQPPFTWIESATDCLEHVWIPNAWDISGCLEFMERYNGLGYRNHGINTPYLWDYTNKYVSGLYVSDGSFDPDAKENRPGAVAILKTLAAKGVSLDFSSLGAIDTRLH